MSPPARKKLPRVFLSRRFRPGNFDKLRVFTDLKVHRGDSAPSPTAYRRAVKEAQVVIPMAEDPIDEAFMDAAPGLRLVANFGVGFDNIDLGAAAVRGILATNTPGAVVGPTAESAMALLLAVCRRIPEADAFVRSGGWEKWTPYLLEGRSLAGRTLGIAGLGGIGSAVARMAGGFGMGVRYWSRSKRSPEEESALGLRYLSLNRLLSESDFVSLHVALSEETRHLIGEAEIARMKKGAILINTARGAVVDERALVRALRSGHLGGAGLDVYEREPIRESPLFGMKNVVMLPHIGSSTDKGLGDMADRVVLNIREFTAGRRPPDLLNPETWPLRRR
ncbi:MAG: D-glycerate dehydrogenase [Nitrospinota bacterium]|nr:D-glycerate dehydrogenase [Nitrospinota bacterium]